MAHTAPDRPEPGDRLVRVGAVVFAVGLLAATVVLAPFFFGRSNAPLALSLVMLLMPVGLAVALSGLLQAARRGRR